MTMLSKLNSIAARIAIAIIFAIILALLMLIGLSVGLDQYGYRQGSGENGARTHVIVSRSSFSIINPRRNPMMLSGGIAVIIRAVASSPRSEQQRVVAAIANPEMQVRDDYTDRLRQLVQIQLETLSPPVLVSAHNLPASNDGHAGRAVVEAAFQDGRRLTFTIPYDLLGNGNGLILFLISVAIVSALVSIWMARRIAAPIREFAGAAERLGLDLTAPPLAVRGPQELRSTIQAVNRMQHRLQRFLEGAVGPSAFARRTGRGWRAAAQDVRRSGRHECHDRFHAGFCAR
jgi:methyl-accepting chemotaxis protein